MNFVNCLPAAAIASFFVPLNTTLSVFASCLDMFIYVLLRLYVYIYIKIHLMLL